MDEAEIARRLGPDPTPRLARLVLWVAVPALLGFVVLVLAGAVRMTLWEDLLVPVALIAAGWGAWSVIEERAVAVRSYELAAEALRSGRLASTWQVRRAETGELVIVDPANWLLFVGDRIVDLEDVGRIDLDGSAVTIETRGPGARSWHLDLGDRAEAAAFRQALADLVGIE